MKRKASTSKAATSKYELRERRVTRLQAKLMASSQAAQRNHQIPASKFSRQVANNHPTQRASLSSSKRFKQTENVDTPDPELQKSGSETIPTQEDRGWPRESDHISSCSTSAAIYAVMGNLMASVLSSAQVDSPAASPRCVQSQACFGDKTKECNTTRLAETTIENTSASEGTLRKENSKSKLVAQHHGRKESDQDAPPLVTAEDITGTAVATVASSSTSGRQLTQEEGRVRSETVKEMPDDVNNSKTNDEPLTQSYSIGLTEMANMHDVSCQDEVESVLLDPALVTVHGYRVKEASAPMLRYVIEKHGDIAMHCLVETVESRSFFLEKMCHIMQTLQTAKLMDITEIEVKKMLALLSDLETVKINVGWLQKRLKEILEAVVLIQHSSKFKECKERNAQIIQKSQRASESYEAQLQELTRSYEAQSQELKEKVSLEEEKIKAAQAENKSIMLPVKNLRPKLKLFVEESLLHDLH